MAFSPRPGVCWRGSRLFSLSAWRARDSWSESSSMTKLGGRPRRGAAGGGGGEGGGGGGEGAGGGGGARPPVFDQGQHATLHLASGLVGEGDGHDLARLGAEGCEEIGNAMSQNSRLAGTRAGQHQHRAGFDGDGQSLRWIETLEEIDHDGGILPQWSVDGGRWSVI